MAICAPGIAVQCKSRGDFTDSRGTFGDHDKLNDDDDHEDDDADRERSACDFKIGERLHDLARARASRRYWSGSAGWWRRSRQAGTRVIASSNDGNTENSSGLLT